MKNSLFFEEPMIWLKGALVFLIGPLDHQLAYLLVVMLVDLYFGVQVARRDDTYSFKKLCLKFGRKLSTYALWIVMFHAFDMIAGLPDTGRLSVILILAGLEIVSSIKNTSKLGHTRLAEALENLYLTLTKQKGGSKDDKPKPARSKQPRKKATSEASDRDNDSV